MARIIVNHQTGSRAGTVEVYPTNRFQSLYFGRDPSCDVQFDEEKDDLVSRSHAVIEWEEDDPSRITISDLLSSNGTYLNGERVFGAVPLNTGDVMQLGKNGPTMRIDIETAPETTVEEDDGSLMIDPGKRTRQSTAVPEDPDPEYEAQREKKD